MKQIYKKNNRIAMTWVDEFLVVAKLRFESSLYYVIILSSCWINILVRHFFRGSKIEIGHTWFSV